eukprot:TRINITY_DN16797_c0_g1_i1.p1 TRINITY_DN16797_c0_g1~~TRINITY_DN16797_c0_g1_i1.p1  ORF type:complete len:144 (-),score=21.45 TRINITY_DN16797_c0_g1_i1:65-451(-)
MAGLAVLPVLSSLLAVSLSLPFPHPLPQDGAGSAGYGKQPDGYFQYVNVPAHKEYEFGWNRGSPEHYISRYEQSKDHRFRTRVGGETTMEVMENIIMSTTMDHHTRSLTKKLCMKPCKAFLHPQSNYV